MFRDKLGQLQVHVCLGVVLVTLLLHVATAQPLVNGGGSKGGEEPATGDDNRKSIANMNPNSRVSGPEKFETLATGGRGTFPCYKKNIGEHVTIDKLRSRRSPKSSSLPSHPQPPSAELQTIMSGNWQAMDPESLFKLLNTLASSKETLPEDFYPFDDDEDDDPIDLVYSGTPPLLSAPSSKSVSSSPFRGAAAANPPPLAEPITLMRSNLGGANKVYKFMDDEDEDDAQPLQMHRMVSKTKKHFPMYKRAYMPRNLWPQRDLVQLPNGEIAFTPHGMRVLRYHQPMPLPLVDADLPLVRRPVL
ncbi:uncharacterized protein LOC110853165 isoform X2 [Folsomia candida]|uniref:uncharacterized protein LOC110853165 isoform X2 n=1 Tax=Folsomia candida TaxID=158441 RepID=UPI000B906903|nr:uncharacterized protein LOC110853165 isoform X2 [Folsomia candida]